MAEETENPPAVIPRRRKAGYNLAQAILAIHERKRVSHFVDYKAIAARYNVNAEGLRSVYCHWTKGRVDIGVIKQTPEDRAIDMQAMHGKLNDLINRHLSLLLIHYEGAIYSAEDKLGTVGKGAHKRMVAKSPLDPKGELAFLKRELAGVLALKSEAEKGYNSALEEIANSRKPQEKPIAPATPGHPATMDVQTRVITAHDERRAIDQLDAAACPAETT